MPGKPRAVPDRGSLVSTIISPSPPPPPPPPSQPSAPRPRSRPRPPLRRGIGAAAGASPPSASPAASPGSSPAASPGAGLERNHSSAARFTLLPLRCSSSRSCRAVGPGPRMARSSAARASGEDAAGGAACVADAKCACGVALGYGRGRCGMEVHQSGMRGASQRQGLRAGAAGRPGDSRAGRRRRMQRAERALPNTDRRAKCGAVGGARPHLDGGFHRAACIRQQLLRGRAAHAAAQDLEQHADSAAATTAATAFVGHGSASPRCGARARATRRAAYGRLSAPRIAAAVVILLLREFTHIRCVARC